MSNNMKVGIFPGSFDPVHKGHIAVVNYLLDNNIVDKVVMVPTMDYWDKVNITNLSDRINMLKYFERENIIIDQDNNNCRYTYELLFKLQEQYKNDELCLIIGADNLLRLTEWKNFDDIIKHKIIVLNRDGINLKKYIDRIGHKEQFIIVEDFIEIDISSTNIRKGLYDGLDEQVLKYIKKNKLYKSI
jgi:nicotinate-nucleotide adenylyltransferase